ncbi:hypothetical protein [Frankia sp. Cas3]|nr:hypothetical protein [Frankia sp. Cas3]
MSAPTGRGNFRPRLSPIRNHRVGRLSVGQLGVDEFGFEVGETLVEGLSI